MSGLKRCRELCYECDDTFENYSEKDQKFLLRAEEICLKLEKKYIAEVKQVEYLYCIEDGIDQGDLHIKVGCEVFEEIEEICSGCWGFTREYQELKDKISKEFNYLIKV